MCALACKVVCVACLHVCVLACLHARVSASVRMCACVRACLRLCTHHAAHVCVRACAWALMYMRVCDYLGLVQVKMRMFSKSSCISEFARSGSKESVGGESARVRHTSCCILSTRAADCDFTSK